MMQNIFVGILAVIAIGSGILGWRIENGGSKITDSKKDEIAQQD